MCAQAAPYCLRPAMWAASAAGQTSFAATTTCRARCDDVATLLRPERRRMAALVPRLGRQLRVGALAVRLQDDDGKPWHSIDPLVRCDAIASGAARSGQSSRHAG